MTKADCCCTMGAGWGDSCETCPRRGGREFKTLCHEQGLGPLGRDIDECKTMPDLCKNGMCINTMGSYRCICDRGYKPDISRTNCEDFNECSRVSLSSRNYFSIKRFRSLVHVNMIATTLSGPTSAAAHQVTNSIEMVALARIWMSVPQGNIIANMTASTPRGVISACAPQGTSNMEIGVLILMNALSNR